MGTRESLQGRWVRRTLVCPDVSAAFDEGLTLWDPALNRGGQAALAAVERSIVPGFLLVDFGLLPTR